jgi:hypothetical protein
MISILHNVPITHPRLVSMLGRDSATLGFMISILRNVPITIPRMISMLGIVSVTLVSMIFILRNAPVTIPRITSILERDSAALGSIISILRSISIAILKLIVIFWSTTITLRSISGALPRLVIQYRLLELHRRLRVFRQTSLKILHLLLKARAFCSKSPGLCKMETKEENHEVSCRDIARDRHEVGRVASAQDVRHATERMNLENAIVKTHMINNQRREMNRVRNKTLKRRRGMERRASLVTFLPHCKKVTYFLLLDPDEVLTYE